MMGATPPTTHGSLTVTVLTHPQFSGERAAERRRATRGAAQSMLCVASFTDRNLVDPASSHSLVSKIKVCFQKKIGARMCLAISAALLPHPPPSSFSSSHACTSLSIKQRNCEWVSCRFCSDACMMLLSFSHHFYLISPLSSLPQLITSVATYSITLLLG